MISTTIYYTCIMFKVLGGLRASPHSNFDFGQMKIAIWCNLGVIPTL